MIESRAISLLGSGFSAETVASALGVTPARISQLLSDPKISQQVSELKYKNLLKHNIRDAELDALEDSLIAKTKGLIPLISKPIEAARIFSLINAAKRRGASTPDHITNQSVTVQITLPTQVVMQFTKNSAGQVIEAGSQSLITIEPNSLKKLYGSHSLAVSNKTSAT